MVQHAPFICLDCPAEFFGERSAQLHEAARVHRVWPQPPPLGQEDRAIARAVARIAFVERRPEREGGAHLRDVRPPHRRHRGKVVQDRHERYLNRMVAGAVNQELAAAGIGRSGLRVSPVGRYWH